MQLRLLIYIPLLCISLTLSASDGTDTVFSSKANEPVTVKSVATMEQLISSNTAARTVLGFTRQGRALEAYFFPGISGKKALVIGGVHGSELSSTEVARMVLRNLTNGYRPYYSVIVIPVLFPDNAAAANSKPDQIGSTKNIGRYTADSIADPNRQMPSPGKPFTANTKDHLGRSIEPENRLLLQLITIYRPQRIVNIHAIRDTGKAGIYADPRTDANGIALGFETDSSLAIAMADHVARMGGPVPGNRLDCLPSALYHCDKPATPAGCMQPRNLQVSTLPGRRGEGVSLGTWAATAVVDEQDPDKSRNAIRILTMEFPGYKRSTDYKNPEDQVRMASCVAAYASAIQAVFLEKYFEE